MITQKTLKLTPLFIASTFERLLGDLSDGKWPVIKKNFLVSSIPFRALFSYYQTPL